MLTKAAFDILCAPVALEQRSGAAIGHQVTVLSDHGCNASSSSVDAGQEGQL